MKNGQSSIRHVSDTHDTVIRTKHSHNEDFVLEKSIFNNIFEKDIRRIFIYKKAERLAKALHLIAPAFAESISLRNRIDAIAIGLVDAAVVPLGAARTALSRELLALSSVLSIARTGGLLSDMNAELITHEAHVLLQEVAAYEEPRLSFDEAPTLSGIAKDVIKKKAYSNRTQTEQRTRPETEIKGHLKDETRTFKGQLTSRSEAVLSIIRTKGEVSIRDVGTLVRGVSEKTIQRELVALIDSGLVVKRGDRRWSTYSLAG